MLQRLLALIACFGVLTGLSDVPKPGDRHVEKLVQDWAGLYSNERQVRREHLAGEPDFPEAVREVRDIRVHRLNAPQLGRHVLLLEEIKATAPDIANRQRVLTFEWLEDSQVIQVTQHFFSTDLAYDQAIIGPKAAAAMQPSDFTHVPGCNLRLSWDPATARFTGGMQRRQCRYKHPQSGAVYADYDMILSDQHFWYRDRSIIEANAAIRGEIEGFSWLRFDKLSPNPSPANGDRVSRARLKDRAPLTFAQEGIWEGDFVRVDPAGRILEVVPSRIVVKFLGDGEPFDYAQTNITWPGTQKERRIESYGKWDVDRLRFSNARLNGWAKDLAEDDTGRSAVFMMTYKDGSNLSITEIVTLSEDGQSRMRATQYIKNGKIVRRTLITEQKVAD